jgi:hypothetical protein
MHADQPPRRYLTRAQLRQRYGGVSDMWVHRRLASDPRFPRPMIISGRHFYDVAELDAYDEALRRDAAQPRADGRDTG